MRDLVANFSASRGHEGAWEVSQNRTDKCEVRYAYNGKIVRTTVALCDKSAPTSTGAHMTFNDC